MSSVIVIRGSNCSLANVDGSILKQLEEKYSYNVLGAEYAIQAQKEKKKAKLKEENPELTNDELQRLVDSQSGWDGRHYVFRNRQFSIGLLPDILANLRDLQVEVSIRDFRQEGNRLRFPSPKITLYPYQQELADKAVRAKISSIQVATGGGKSLIGFEFIRQIGLRSLVIVPNIEILNQMEQHCINYLNIFPGVIGNKRCDVNVITIATWQSLSKGGFDNLISTIDVLVVDEAQHLGAEVLRKIASEIPASYRLGMSGTLFREDNADLDLFASTGPKIETISYSWLIEHGYLVPAKIQILKFPRKYYAKYTTYQEIYRDYVVENDYRNNFIIKTAEQLVAEGRRVLVFASTIEQGKKLEGQNKKFVYSNHPKREDLINSFKSGKLNCLISTAVLDEGFDVPPIDGLILASPHKSLIKTIQRIGRSLRTYENKKDAIIIDSWDNVPYLNDHYARRRAYYDSERAWKIEKIIDVSKEVEEDIWS